MRTPDGAPVEDFNLYCLRAGDSQRGGVRSAGSLAQGRARCRLPAGDYELLVVPRSEHVLAADAHSITIAPNRAEIVIEVPRAVARVVEVLFAGDRTGMAGVLVEAIVGEEPALFEWVCPATAIKLRHQSHANKVVLASAHSDERGRATLQLREPGLVHLRVSGPGVRTLVSTVDLAQAAAAATPILGERGATLLGSVGPAAALPARVDQASFIGSTLRFVIGRLPPAHD